MWPRKEILVFSNNHAMLRPPRFEQTSDFRGDLTPWILLAHKYQHTQELSLEDIVVGKTRSDVLFQPWPLDLIVFAHRDDSNERPSIEIQERLHLWKTSDAWGLLDDLTGWVLGHATYLTESMSKKTLSSMRFANAISSGLFRSGILSVTISGFVTSTQMGQTKRFVQLCRNCNLMPFKLSRTLRWHIHGSFDFVGEGILIFLGRVFWQLKKIKK